VGGAVAAGAAGGLGEHPIAAGALEGVDLELGLLVGGGRRWRSQAGVPCRERRRTLGRVGCATLISDTGSGHVEGRWPGDWAAVAKRNGFGQLTCDSTRCRGRPMTSSVRVSGGPPLCRPAFPRSRATVSDEVRRSDAGPLARLTGLCVRSRPPPCPSTFSGSIPTVRDELGRPRH
jgi:hypothetical protein